MKDVVLKPMLFVSVDGACLKDVVLKPMLFVSVDGGPDEAPKSTMTVKAWIAICKEYDLDNALIFTHAPGRN